MANYPVPDNEAQRLLVANELISITENAEVSYDDLTQVIAEVFEVPVVLVNLIGDEQLVCRSRVGIELTVLARELSFCAHTICQSEPLIVDDLREDPRFTNHPLVIAPPEFRFYAGIPLVLGDGLAVGTLCLLDYQPRSLSVTERQRFRVFGQQMQAWLALQQKTRQLEIESYASNYHAAYCDTLIRSAPVAMLRIDSNGRVLESNPFARQLLGYGMTEMLQLAICQLIPVGWEQFPGADKLAPGCEQLPSDGAEVQAIRADGQLIAVHLAVSQILSSMPGGASEYLAVLTDLSGVRQAEQREQEERMLLRSVLEASREPIYARDQHGNYLIANEACLKRQCDGFADTGELLGRVEQQVIARGVAIGSQRLSTDGKHIETTYSPLKNAAGVVCGVVAIEHDISALSHLTAQLEREQMLLKVLHRGLTDYRSLVSGNSLWQFLMDALQGLTGSEYAMIGEVVEGGDQLRVHAISELDWSDESRAVMADLLNGKQTLDSPETIFGKVYIGGETLIVNEIPYGMADPVFPPGYSTFFRYLGVPICYQGEILGMFAIANSPDVYDEDLVAWLEPFTSTCALLINLYRSFDERARIINELRETSERAERASQAKSEFLSSMSHELRTPLNSILGFAQLLLSGKNPLTERQERQVKQIYTSGKHLLELINDVLDLARIEAGRITLSIETIGFCDVTLDVMDIFTPLAQERGIELLLDQQQTEHAYVLADYTRLKQVLINLISNAIKYNRDGGRVVVRCRMLEHQLEVSIEDTGQGIAKERLCELFQPFNRLGAEAGSVEGTGIGLALTRQLIELMGGEIGVESQPGEGCRFWFRLPLEDSSSGQYSDQEFLPEPVVSPIQRNNLVLYVEDNLANQRLMADVFEDIEGCELVMANSAEMGLELACSESPDLILMDIDLPGIDGFQAQTLLAKNPMTSAIPVIGVSAGANASHIRRARLAGFYDYLTKPVDIPRLTELVRHLLSGEAW
ncbi:ATP-binding protein [Oceanobacter mangrovi]|uniref:ATP-binding protein n=1 Tax=Oceanobacter mangrovi TaxID=2862510 RepID=UPI001C8D8E32|nr:ATP-binding protein [Oceanobacter mangrovi]